MTSKDKDDLYYVCSLIEFLRRKTKNHIKDIVKILGSKEIKRQLYLAEVNHSLSFEQVADELIQHFNIKDGSFDSVSNCKYTVPTFLSIGKVYQTLIINTKRDDDDLSESIYTVLISFICDEISNFNSSVYYSNPDYLKFSYLEGKLLP
ncbi:MAG: hypothetical protein ACRDAU_00675 [Clostridium sp.]